MNDKMDLKKAGEIDQTMGQRMHRANQSDIEFGTLFEISPDPMVVYDHSGKMVYINAAFEETYGWSFDEIYNKRIDFVPDEEIEPTRDAWRRTLKGEKVFLETRRLTKEGRHLDIQLRTAIVEKDGHHVMSLVIHRDITPIKQAEKALRESEKRFRAIFSQAAVGVALTNTLTGRIIKANRKYCDIIGYSMDEIEGLDFQSITYPGDLPADLTKMQELIEGKIHEFSIEKRYLHSDGSRVWAKLTVSPMWGIGESPTQHIAVIEDITDRKIMEAKVKTLSGFLPICASCKKIRDDKGYWNQIEIYIKEHSEADFSHSICPGCAKKLYPDLEIPFDNGSKK